MLKEMIVTKERKVTSQFELTGLIMDLQITDLTHTQKLILIVLSKYTNFDHGELRAWPSLGELVLRTNIKKASSIGGHLWALSKMGFISKVDEVATDRGKPVNVWRINIHKLKQYTEDKILSIVEEPYLNGKAEVIPYDRDVSNAPKQEGSPSDDLLEEECPF
jgi:hypothetical protein